MNAPKELTELIYENSADRNADESLVPDGGLCSTKSSRTVSREHGGLFKQMLNEKPKVKHWWVNITNAVRSVFQDAAKKNGVDLEGLRGLGAEEYIAKVAEQLAAGRELNEWTAYGKDMAYFPKGVAVGGGEGERMARSPRGDLIESNIRSNLKHSEVYNKDDAYHFAYSAQQNEIAFYTDNGDLTFDIMVRAPLTEKGIAHVKRIADRYRTDENGRSFDTGLQEARSAMRSRGVDYRNPVAGRNAEGRDGTLDVGQSGDRSGSYHQEGDEHIRYSRHDRAANPYDERTEDGRKFNEKYGSARTGDVDLGCCGRLPVMWLPP